MTQDCHLKGNRWATPCTKDKPWAGEAEPPSLGYKGSKGRTWGFKEDVYLALVCDRDGWRQELDFDFVWRAENPLDCRTHVQPEPELRVERRQHFLPKHFLPKREKGEGLHFFSVRLSNRTSTVCKVACRVLLQSAAGAAVRLKASNHAAGSSGHPLSKGDAHATVSKTAPRIPQSTAIRLAAPPGHGKRKTP